MITFDHIAVGAASLMDGLEWIEETLHMKIPAGGKHDQMGTHNHVISSRRDNMIMGSHLIVFATSWDLHM